MGSGATVADTVLLISSGDTRSDRTAALRPGHQKSIVLFLGACVLIHQIVLFLLDLNRRGGKSRNMRKWIFGLGKSLACSWFILRRSLLFTLPFGGGNGYIPFISPPDMLSLSLIILPHVKSYVFVITALHEEPPSFISRIHQAIRWSVGLVITTSYLLVIIYQAQSYKHPTENNGRTLPQPGMALLSQRHGLSEIVMGVIRDSSLLKKYIWTCVLPLTGSIIGNRRGLDRVIMSLFMLCINYQSLI